MKTEFKGTPGDWFIREGDFYSYMVMKSDNLIAFVYDGSDRIKGDLNTALANARLIAAAPELLEALQIMVTIMDGLTEAYPALRNEPAISKAKEVIAKALGL